MDKLTKEQLREKVEELKRRNYNLECEVGELKTRIKEAENYEEALKKAINKRSNQIHFLAGMLVSKGEAVSVNTYLGDNLEVYLAPETNEE